jgi:hypothetical protein
MWIGLASRGWWLFYLWSVMRKPFQSHDSLPASDASVTCANCGHEMNLAQTEGGPRPVQNWPLT